MQTVTQKPKQFERRFPKMPNRRTLIIAALGCGVATLGAATFYTLSRTGTGQPGQTSIALNTPAARSVTALGRLEPQGEVISLAASSQGSRVEQLLVKQGDRVQAGQVIAVMDSRDRLQAALERAQNQVQVAQAQLEKVKAGAKTGDIDAQAATVNRMEAELNNAQVEYQRYQALYREGAISASQLDSKRLVLDTTRAQLQQSNKTLQSVAEVRPVDVRAAEADVNSAMTAAKQAQADLDLAYIRAPRDGQILKIHTYPGEIVGNDGIVELGKTAQMYVVAEVYESDIQQVRLGQKTVITSSAFKGEAHGFVDEIGLQIKKKGILDTNPTADADARVVEVKIRLDKSGSRKVAGLTNLQVTTQILRDQG
ncbi:ABC exporter membrane fusion protein [Kovacikia minuta CCNUW1]|uniref:ABC exporter membrane fusion protein n=1 Tax=Kovacikia minuta TaxID=2931930 RepID=UPI001CCF3B5A|nr:ABC exporter membrane fusion protein [Kovacikia minuta]UBF23559.1 ABC exporter membrane fusion protein [Kovacikia minuta CCNUW1]